MVSTDIAVTQGNYFTRGGSERVADAIAATFDAPLYYGYGDESAMPEDGIDRRQVFAPSWLGRQLAHRVGAYRDLRFLWDGMAIEAFTEYDVLIHSGNEFGLYPPVDGQTVIKYVHSPPLSLYTTHGAGHLTRAYALAAKTLYRHALACPDLYLANSEVVANRCRRYWGVDARVVYPPVNVATFGRDNAVNSKPDTYLAISRLDRRKRVGEIVRAFEALGPGHQLIVAGDGPRRGHIKAIAPANVEVRGHVSETEKRRLYAECVATIFNGRREDFGIVPVEAMASGRPVIGVDDGFTAEQIRDGVNGIHIDGAGTAEAVASAVERFERDGVDWDASELEAFAERFSRERFAAELKDAVGDAMDTQAPKCWRGL